MGLQLVRTTATVPAGGTYIPNGLLSGAFELTLQGSATIGPPTLINDGTLWWIRVNFGPSHAAVLSFDRAAYDLIQNFDYGPGMGGGSLMWLFLMENGKNYLVRHWGL